VIKGVDASFDDPTALDQAATPTVRWVEQHLDGTLIGFLVRRGWLAVPRPTSAPMAVTFRTGKPAAPEPQERMAA
jgi:hypothetical protein